MKIKVHSNGFELSKIVIGFWRVNGWGYNDVELLDFIKYAIDLGFTSFDHADIYGCYTAQEFFGRALRLEPSLRDKIELVSKCSIKNKCIDKNQKVNYYDTSKKWILASVENSLTQLATDNIDLLLIHRPDPIMNPEVIAETFDELYKSGKVNNFGVSNFTPPQFAMLQSYTDLPLVTNQIEFSPLHSEPIYDGTFDNAMEHRIKPMIWSPLAGGRIFNPTNEREEKVKRELESVAVEVGNAEIDQIAFAWINKHPANPVIVSGTGKKERLKAARESLDIELSTEQWFRILKACNQCDVP